MELVYARIYVLKMVKMIVFVEKDLYLENFVLLAGIAMDSMELAYVRIHVLQMVKTIVHVEDLEQEKFV